MFERFIESLITRSRRYFILSIVVFLILTSGLVKFSSNYSIPSWFGENSPRIHKLNNYVKTFGGRGVHYVAIAFSATVEQIDLAQVGILIGEVAKIPYVQGVESSFNYRHISKVGNDIVMEAMMKKFPEKKTFFSELDKVESLKRYLVSKDLDFHVLYVRVDDEVEDKNLSREFLRSVQDTINKYGQKSLQYSILGSIKMTATGAEFSVRDNIRVIPLMFLVMVLVLFWQYRNLYIVLASLLVVGMTQISSLGLYFHLGYTFNILSAIIPGTLFPISLASTVHVFYNFFLDYKESNNIQKALGRTLSKNFLPVFLTSTTTAIGFFSISFIEIIPLRSLGVVCSIGTFLAFFYTYSVIPYLIELRGDKLKQKGTVKEKNLSHLLFTLVQNYRKKIVIFFIILVSFATYKAFNIIVDNDLLKIFPEDAEINTSYHHLRQKMEGASRRFPLVIDSGKEDGVLEPEFLNRVENFIHELEQNGDVKNVTSGLDYIKQTNQALHDNNPAFYALPQTREELKASLDLYESKLPPETNIYHRISKDRRFLKLRNYWQVESSAESINKSVGYTKLGKEKYGLDVSINGFFAIYSALNGIIVDIYFNSMICVILTVFLIMVIKFKNLLYAFLTMIPNIVSMIILLGFMSLTGIELNLGTCIVASLCLGITIDDSIHFMSSYIQRKKETLSVVASLKSTLGSTGESIYITTFVLVLSFACFILGETVMYKHFGILCVVGLIGALTAGLLFLPAIILTLEGKTKPDEL